METLAPLPDRTPARERYLEQLRAIHGLRDRLGLEPAAYRALLERLTGLPSAKAMSPRQRDHVIAFLEVHAALEESMVALEAARDRLHALTPRLEEPGRPAAGPERDRPEAGPDADGSDLGRPLPRAA